MSKVKDIISLIKAKAYIYIDGTRGTFWGNLKDEEVLGTWHTLISIKTDLSGIVKQFEEKHFPTKKGAKVVGNGVGRQASSPNKQSKVRK